MTTKYQTTKNEAKTNELKTRKHRQQPKNRGGKTQKTNSSCG